MIGIGVGKSKLPRLVMPESKENNKAQQLI